MSSQKPTVQRDISQKNRLNQIVGDIHDNRNLASQKMNQLKYQPQILTPSNSEGYKNFQNQQNIRPSIKARNTSSEISSLASSQMSKIYIIYPWQNGSQAHQQQQQQHHRQLIKGIELENETSDNTYNTGNYLTSNEQDTRLISEKKKHSALHHHGGSKSLDQQQFKRTGQGNVAPINYNKNQGGLLQPPRHSKNCSSSSAILPSGHSLNQIREQKQGSHQYEGDTGAMNVQRYLNQNKPSESRTQHSDVSAEYPPSKNKLNIGKQQQIDKPYIERRYFSNHESNENIPPLVFNGSVKNQFQQSNSQKGNKHIIFPGYSNDMGSTKARQSNHFINYSQVDMSGLINNSINQRDISIIKPANIQDLSCFSRDQSMFLLEGNNRDLSINMRDQSSFFQTNGKRNMPFIQHNSNGNCASNCETPNAPMNENKTFILENFSKDLSENISSKVEEISSLLEQEKEKNVRLQEKLIYQDTILQNMKDIQENLYNNLEQAQKKLSVCKSDIQMESRIDHLESNVKGLEEENMLLREQISKAEEIHELKQKDLINQIAKFQREKEEIQVHLQSKIDSLASNLNNLKKHYDEKLLRMQQKKSHDKENQHPNLETHNYKILVQQLMTEYDVEKENELLPRIKQLANKDVLKLVDCLTNMILNFAPKGCFENKPTIKHIWKWLKNLLREYMVLKQTSNTSSMDKDILKQAFKYVQVDKQSDFISKLAQIVVDNESYSKIINHLKIFFRIPSSDWRNLYEIQCFIEQKNQNQNNNKSPNFHDEQQYKTNFSNS